MAVVVEPRYRLRELEAVATPGPWVAQSADGAEWYIDTHVSPFGPEPVWSSGHSVSEIDAALIAEMRNALPELLDVTADADAFGRTVIAVLTKNRWGVYEAGSHVWVDRRRFADLLRAALRGR